MPPMVAAVLACLLCRLAALVPHLRHAATHCTTAARPPTRHCRRAGCLLGPTSVRLACRAVFSTARATQ